MFSVASRVSKLAGSTGLEPAASAVTGQRSNQLNYDPLGACAPRLGDAERRNGRCRFRTCDSRRVKPVLYH